jgi:hypothetical protein
MPIWVDETRDPSSLPRPVLDSTSQPYGELIVDLRSYSSASKGNKLASSRPAARVRDALSLDAGVSLRDVQDAAGHADPRTTRRYDRARYNLDRHPTYALAGLIS